MSEHVHRFNATLLTHVGRCSCGAFGKHYRGAWTTVTHAASIKGIQTQLDKLRAPDPDPVLRVLPPGEPKQPRRIDTDGLRELPDPRSFRDPGRLS